MKKIRLIIFVLLLALTAGSLSGCSETSAVFHGIRVGCITNQASDHVYLSCEEFDGGVTYTINVNESHQQRIECDISVNSGVLTISVEDTYGSTLYTEAISFEEDAFPFDIELPNYGRYRIVIEAEEFSGSYRLSWAK